MGDAGVSSQGVLINATTAGVPTDWTLNERDLCDLEMLLMGAFDPLKGYLTREDYFSVLNKMRLASGELWPLPIVLPIPKTALTLSPPNENDNGTGGGAKIMKLRDQVGTIVAELDVTDVYEPDVILEMKMVLGSTDENHPFSRVLASYRDCVYIGGPVRKVHPILHFDFRDYRMSAPDVRSFIKKHKWNCVVAFQTRNPMHRSHFELTRQAMQEAAESSGEKAHLLLSPVVGPTQPGDVDYHIRVRCYEKILKYYGTDSVKLILLPVAMRMAGPREALWHAIIRRNYGCTHFIVGRDHAGPSAKKSDGSTFYGTYEAHELLKSVQAELGIRPVFGRDMQFADPELGYIQADRIPPGVQTKSISGTEVRRMLETRQPVPEWFSFPDVSEELQKFFKPNCERGFCVYFTGLPCSGKSTLAVALEAAIQESTAETRRVTVLDADVIRTHLSKGLGFSRNDRQLNVRRIGYVSSEIVKHGGICLVANIAPYEEDRLYNRKLISGCGGGYVEVFVSTPLEVCEQRDIKELYKKARLGVIKQFTGISDPYEVPKNPELVIDSSEKITEKVQQVLDYLTTSGWWR